VKDYIREHRRRGRKMSVPLQHPPGHAQADFGEASVVSGGVEQTAHFFAFDLPHSDASFVSANPAAPGWTVMSTPSRRSGVYRSRCSTTTTDAWWRASCAMGPASGPRWPAVSCRTT